MQIGVMFMEDEGEPAEITRIKSELETVAAGSEQKRILAGVLGGGLLGLLRHCWATRSSASGTGPSPTTGRTLQPAT
jgi:hypothetical protein